MGKRNNRTKTTSLLVNKISNMSIPYLEEYSDRVVGIYLSPYKVGKNRHIEIVVVKNNAEEIPVLEPETTVKNTRIYLSVCDISNYTLKETWYTDYKYVKDLKSGHIVYDPKKKLQAKQNKLSKSGNIPWFSNRDEIDNEIVSEVKTKLMTK